MKNIVLLILCFVIINKVNAQKKWSFGAEAFPNYSKGELKTTGNTNPSLVQLIDERETWKFCLSGLLFATYKLNSRSSIQFGLGYQNNGERTKYMQFTYGDMTDPRTGFGSTTISDPNAIMGTKFYYNRHNIQIPILYQFNLTSRFYLKTGLSTIFNFSNTTTLQKHLLSGKRERSTENDTQTSYRGVNLSGQFGIGFDYVQRTNFSLYVQPTIEKFLIGVSTNAPINRVPLSLGIVFGVRI